VKTREKCEIVIKAV